MHHPLTMFFLTQSYHSTFHMSNRQPNDFSRITQRFVMRHIGTLNGTPAHAFIEGIVGDRKFRKPSTMITGKIWVARLFFFGNKL
ncbi:MAG: hypothetical protein D6820_16285 [Lentisphaerae bacterium]|nr:MAG: hypothetical protein D6820_16285 [Lentisphaerota bacterium]